MDEVQNTGGVKVTETKHTRFGFKRLLNRRSEGKIPGRAIAILLLVVIILAGGIYGWRLRQESIATRNSICNGRDDNEFYKQLAINFHPNRYKELYANTLKINQTKGHEKDANCVYALFRYDIVSGDVSSARSSLALLKRVYEPKKAFVEPFANQIKNLGDAEKEMADLEKAIQSTKTDTIYF